MYAAIVEFIEPAEARVAFKKLAYTKFGGMPLYLEWAPLETFKSSTSVAEPSESKGTKMLETQDTKSPALPSIDEEELFDMIPEPDTTLFVKNLNFDTVEETIRNVSNLMGVNLASLNSTEGVLFCSILRNVGQFTLLQSLERRIQNNLDYFCQWVMVLFNTIFLGTRKKL